jgi:hypothetical protein
MASALESNSLPPANMAYNYDSNSVRIRAMIEFVVGIIMMTVAIIITTNKVD